MQISIGKELAVTYQKLIVDHKGLEELSKSGCEPISSKYVDSSFVVQSLVYKSTSHIWSIPVETGTSSITVTFNKDNEKRREKCISALLSLKSLPLTLRVKGTIPSWLANIPFSKIEIEGSCNLTDYFDQIEVLHKNKISSLTLQHNGTSMCVTEFMEAHYMYLYMFSSYIGRISMKIGPFAYNTSIKYVKSLSEGFLPLHVEKLEVNDDESLIDLKGGKFVTELILSDNEDEIDDKFFTQLSTRFPNLSNVYVNFDVDESIKKLKLGYTLFVKGKFFHGLG